jgi:hypothetical protein
MRPPSMSLEDTDLTRFSNEVLTKGSEAVLPQNLSDEWLRLLARDLVALETENRAASPRGGKRRIAPALAVAKLLEATPQNRQQRRSKNRPSPELNASDALAKYAFAIYTEIIGRYTGMYMSEDELALLVR